MIWLNVRISCFIHIETFFEATALLRHRSSISGRCARAYEVNVFVSNWWNMIASWIDIVAMLGNSEPVHSKLTTVDH